MSASIAEIREILKDVAVSQKETNEIVQKTAESQKKTDKIVKEVALLQKENHEEITQSHKETNEQIKETQASLKKLSKLFGNTQKNQGPIVEEFFYNSLKENMVVGGVKYHSIAKNVRPPVNPRNEEYDIVMVNREQILLIEVKLKAHSNDIEKLLRQMSHYPEHFPQYKDFKLIGALATFSADAIFGSDALLPGMMILQRSGKVIKTIVK